MWPWSGYLALFIRVTPEGAGYTGDASGTITFTITSPPAPDEDVPRRSTVVLPFKARIIPTPARHLRVLWDQFHRCVCGGRAGWGEGGGGGRGPGENVWS